MMNLLRSSFAYDGTSKPLAKLTFSLAIESTR